MSSTPNRVRDVTRRRGRPTHSCDACYSRKIACDVAKPKCNWCSTQDLPCTFQRTRCYSRKGSSTSVPVGNVARSFAGNIDSGEKAWAPTFARNLQFAGSHLGNICSFDGTPILSASGREWVEACTGEELHMDPYPINETPSWLDSSPASNLPLPDLASLYEDIKQYQSSIFGSFFPIIDLKLFEKTIKTAYFHERSWESPSVTSAKACVLAFLALRYQVVDSSIAQTSRLTRGVEYAREAYWLLPTLLKESVTVDGLQAFLLLCLCAQGHGGDHVAIDNLLSLATRYIFHLRSNLSPQVAVENPNSLHYHARTLFWITYVCDKGFTLLTGLPPRLEDIHCDLSVELPPEQREATHRDGDPYPGSYLHTYVKLARIQSRIYHELYVPGALHHSDAELLRIMRNLDSSLEEWKNSIPLENRPAFMPPPSGSTSHATDLSFSIFHLQYHHSLVMIHQCSSRCTSWTGNQDTQNTSSSLAMSVTACRSLLQTFVTHCLELGPPNLLFCLSFFIRAVINLFCKVLSHPLSRENQEDIYLMKETYRLVARSYSHDDPLCYVAKARFAEEFILELERLAQAAIHKAA